MGQIYTINDVDIDISYDREDENWKGKRNVYMIDICCEGLNCSFAYFGKHINYNDRFYPELLEDVLHFIVYLYFETDNHEYQELKHIVTKDWVDNAKVYLKLSKT
jgi:hypothetical protein